MKAKSAPKGAKSGAKPAPKGAKPAPKGTKPGAKPTRFQQFGARYPSVMAAYEALGEATQLAGPLDPKTRALIKLGIATGSWREGAVHSHARRALEAGASPDEIRHAVLLATTTLGFPSMMAALTWVEDVLARQ